MKKTSIILTIILLLTSVAMLTGCEINSNYSAAKTSSATPSTELVETEDKSNTSPSTTKPQTNYNYQKEEEQKHYSTTIAISGAIIVEDDHESTVVYSRKCDSCGYVESDRRVTNPGGIISSFFCQKCGENSKLELRTTYSN